MFVKSRAQAPWMQRRRNPGPGDLEPGALGRVQYRYTGDKKKLRLPPYTRTAVAVCSVVVVVLFLCGHIFFETPPTKYTGPPVSTDPASSAELPSPLEPGQE